MLSGKAAVWVVQHSLLRHLRVVRSIPTSFPYPLIFISHPSAPFPSPLSFCLTLCPKIPRCPVTQPIPHQ
ncbi:hypothetical protein B484DRAFT_455494 [Ochromonadaceae sp. CCMP2298]|nr:hypothetical protein B484DRAFT_455494 [Ochromonadaceae sp. CCMP2298]